jgi:hypothetical protein
LAITDCVACFFGVKTQHLPLTVHLHIVSILNKQRKPRNILMRVCLLIFGMRVMMKRDVLQNTGSCLQAHYSSLGLHAGYNNQEVEIINWTDSMTVLCWIGNNTLWKQYVMRRGRDSSIDLQGFMEALSRYEEPRRFAISWSESKRPWWEDPEFLQKSEDEWPKCSSEEPDTALNEVVKKQPVVTHSGNKGLQTKSTGHYKEYELRKFLYLDPPFSSNSVRFAVYQQCQEVN